MIQLPILAFLSNAKFCNMSEISFTGVHLSFGTFRRKNVIINIFENITHLSLSDVITTCKFWMDFVQNGTYIIQQLIKLELYDIKIVHDSYIDENGYIDSKWGSNFVGHDTNGKTVPFFEDRIYDQFAQELTSLKQLGLSISHSSLNLSHLLIAILKQIRNGQNPKLSYLRIQIFDSKLFQLGAYDDDLRLVLSSIAHISSTALIQKFIDYISPVDSGVDQRSTRFNNVEKLSFDRWKCYDERGCSYYVPYDYLCNKYHIRFYKLKMLEINYLFTAPSVEGAMQALMKFQTTMRTINIKWPLFIKIGRMKANVHNHYQSIKQFVKIASNWFGSCLIHCNLEVRQQSNVDYQNFENRNFALLLVRKIEKYNDEHISWKQKSDIIAQRFDNEYCYNYSKFVVKMVTHRCKSYCILLTNCQENYNN